MKKYYTYILKCSDGTYYTGYTTDLENRVKSHNEKKGAKYTRGRTPVTLMYYEEFETKSEALKREAQIKRLNLSQKLKLMTSKVGIDNSQNHGKEQRNNPRGNA